MMQYIDKIHRIQKETLNEEHYLQSLLEQAYAQQLLTDAEMEKVQLDCLSLLTKHTERLNRGFSSSIRIEKAQDMLASIFFTVGVRLKTDQSPDDAIAALQRHGVERIFAEGQTQIDRLLKKSRIRHAALLGRLLPSKNVFYAATIEDGINGFFQLYRPEFAAQEIHITADYPVYNKAERLQGIEFISQYLNQLYCENAFCMHFSAKTIHYLLCGYDEHYEKLLFNLYEPVLAASLGAALSGSNVQQLKITPEIQTFLSGKLLGKGRAEIEILLAAALFKMGKQLSFTEGLRRYLQQSLPLLAATIESASIRGTLDRVFIAPKYPEQTPKLFVCKGQKMSDEAYRKVVDNYIDCQSAEEKTKLVKEQIHALEDFDELLLDVEPSMDEIVLLLTMRSPAEIAVLMKKYCAAYDMSFHELRDAEKRVHEGLQRFVEMLPLEQRNILKTAAAVLADNEGEL